MSDTNVENALKNLPSDVAEPLREIQRTVVESSQVAQQSLDAIAANERAVATLNERTDEVHKAVAAVEQNVENVTRDVTEKIRRIQTASRDANGHYRGVCGSEEIADGLGLMVMGFGAGDEVCRDALKSDHPELHERAQSATEGAKGGFLIPTTMINRITWLAENYGVFLDESGRVPVGPGLTTWFLEKDEFDMYLVGEGTAPGEQVTDFNKVNLTVREWGTHVFYPKKLDRDAAVDMGEIFTRRVAHALARTSDRVGFNGTGSVPDMRVVGVIERLRDVDGAGTDSAGLVSLSGVDAFSEVLNAHVEQLMGTLPQYASANAKHYCHRAYFFSVLARLARAAGGVTAAEIEGRRQLMHGGYPVRISQVLENTGGNTKVPHLFGDLQQAALHGIHRNLGVERSDQYRFLEGMVTLKASAELDINVAHVGSATEVGPILGLEFNT